MSDASNSNLVILLRVESDRDSDSGARQYLCNAAVDEIERLQQAFKNFHRLLCERFDYGHDEKDWERDQLSLIEWIAKRYSQDETTDEDKADLLSMAAVVARAGRESDGVKAELMQRASRALIALAETRQTRRHRGCGPDCALPAGHLGDHLPLEPTPVTWTCPSCSMRGRPADAYVCTNCGEKRPENERA